MKNIIKKSISVFMCILMILSCLNVSVFTEIGTLIAQAADNSLSAGDINGDGTVNNKDLTRLLKHIAGEDVEVVERFLDTNGDGTVNNKDLTRLLRFIAGDEVEIFPKGCPHELEGVEAVKATCTENGNIAYWQCKLCGDLFSDEGGTQGITLDETITEKIDHTIEIIPGYPATMTKPGLTEGEKCSVCGTITKEQNEIPISEFEIKYVIAGSDNYLTKLLNEGKIENNNPISYSTEKGCKLSNILVDGYIFDGWYDAPGSSGEPIKEIPIGSTGEIELYAKWSKEQYKISFYSPLAPRSSITRTIDESVPIDDLNELTKYKFMGWTDVYGNIVTMVEPGTKDITLYANWVSYRNQTISHDYEEKGPITIEDGENGQYIFVYDIGKIINVPLYTIKDFGNTTSGIIRVESETVKNSISSTHAKEITESIANSTTNSATWTLSKDWNELVTNTEDFSETELKENNILISDGYAHTDGTEKSTGTVSDTGTLDRDNTTTKDLWTNKEGSSLEVGGNVKFGSDKTPVSANISAQYEKHKDKTFEGGTLTDDGTDTYNLTHTNDLTSSINSKTKSHDETISNKIAEEASRQWGYSISKSEGGTDSHSENTSNTQNKENTYSSSFAYTVAEEVTTVKEFSTSNAAPGWHRLVCAGTIHVFAVVGYDIATHSYYYYTYSILDDKTSEFYDYSATNGEYNDYETGVLPFEVPISIHEYISDRTCLSPGLEVDTETGIITAYDSDNELAGEYVNIPDYYSIDNDDGTYEVVKIVGIDPGVFKNNTKIKGVRLSDFITEIPDDLFNGCSSLEYVKYNNIVSIGNNSFKGCKSLEDFEVNGCVTHLGDNAFESVSKVVINVEKSDVLNNAANCAANKLTVNLKGDSEKFSDMKITISEKTDDFTINGFKGTYKNFEIVSNSSACTINGFNFVNNIGVPITLTSSKVTLINTNVIDAPNFTINLKADNTEIIANGTNTFTTTGDFAFLSKNISIQKNSSVKSSLNISGGQVYVFGSELTENDLKYFNSEFEINYINEEEYQRILDSRYVIFDSNGGMVDTERKLVISNSKIGELPTPEREYYSFDGWYTSLEGGEKVTADTEFTASTDMILYAHWTRKIFKVSFNANGGSVSTANKNVELGATYGSLPTPTRDYYNFSGWYTAASGGEKVTADTVMTKTEDVTLYAQWTQKPVSDWVKASAMPAGAQVVETKWTYTLTEYTTNSASSLSGWEKYDTKRTSWGPTQGPVYSNPSNGSRNVWDESYIISSNYKTVYKYWRYAASKEGTSGYSYQYQASGTNYYEYVCDSRLPYKSSAQTGGVAGYGYTVGSKWILVWECNPCEQQQWVSDNYGTRWYYQEPIYTYYYRRYLSKEATSDPTNWDNTSNEVKWVMYRPK